MSTTTAEKVTAAASGLWVAGVALAIVMVVAGFVWPGGADADVPPGAPVKLRLVGMKHPVPVVPIKLDADKALDPPRDPKMVGWWIGSAKPGKRQGQTVITGHTVHTGGGTLDRLGRLQDGESIAVVTKKARVSYKVEDVEVLSKKELARDAQRLFGQDHGDGQLVLVTCTDWNGHDYESNVVVTAERYAAQKLHQKKPAPKHPNHTKR